MTRLLAVSVLGIITTACGNTAKRSGAEETATDNTSKGTVLLVASSESSLKLTTKEIPTGYYLDELAVPAQALIAAGYDIVVATPKGDTPVMDEKSNTAELFQNDENKLNEALNFVKTFPPMLNPISLSDAVKGGLDRFAAVYVPGGHAPMIDLMQDKNLGEILHHFHGKGKPTALLCHGPVATLAALPEANAYRQALAEGNKTAIENFGKDWIYSGYRMTIYSNEEEYDVEDYLGGKIEFYVADALRNAGGKVEKSAAKNMPLVVRDRELITGQNPASDHAIADELIKALEEMKK
ncbi:type 1 glutamine amidotransferase domain-containing protein [Proteiniphilum sp. X52]|nr:type 1 glutamine amidotransferase domain-containing protein [Proteiniphilum sp. X52]